jgi:hypothetical protein
MKKNYSKFILFIAISLINSNLVLSQFKIDAEYRTRFEYRDGYQKLPTVGSDPAIFISQRTRLSFGFETDKLKLKFTPQDVRVWGDEQISTSTGVFGDNASLEVFEGYAEIKAAAPLWISVGRQQISYDNKRIFGDRNWSQTGIAYDAVICKFNFTNTKLNAGASWNSNTDGLSGNLYPSSRIKSLNFLWMNRKFSEDLNVSLLHVASGVTETDTTETLYFRQTSGFYGEYKTKTINVSGDVYYQYGKNQKGKTVSAYLTDLEASYKISDLWIGIGLSYLSGNKKKGADQTADNLFDVLYGNRHKFFGYIDYFRNFSVDTKQGGLADYYFFLEYNFSDKLNIRNTAYLFQLAQTNPTTPTEKNLGWENDLVLKYKFSDWGVLESGYCFYQPTESLKKIQGITGNKFPQFFYLQLSITPLLFKQEQIKK